MLTDRRRHGRALRRSSWRLALDRARDHAAHRRRRVPLQPRLAPGAARRAAALADVTTVRRGERSSASASSRRSRRRSARRRGSRAASERVFDADVRANAAARALRAAARVPAACSRSAGVLLVGGRMVVDGDAHARRVLRLQPPARMLIVPLRMLGMWIGQAQRATAVRRAHLRGARRAGRDRATRPTPTRCRRRRRRECGSRASRFGYDAGRPVLDDVDLDDPRPAATVALIGPTGWGKTTLADARAALLRRQRRAACSSTASTCATSTLARRCAARSASISQDPFLFSATVAREHRVRRPRRDATRTSRAARASAPRRTSSSRRCPTATTPSIGERGLTLSGGQRQRLAIARALVDRPARS